MIGNFEIHFFIDEKLGKMFLTHNITEKKIDKCLLAHHIVSLYIC